MKTSLYCALLVAATLVGSGCRTYNYRVVQPPQAATGVITNQSVSIQFDPLDYQLQRYRDRLAMRITNPTDDRVILHGQRSYVVDTQGESHPLRGRVIGPHSFTLMLLPPVPLSAEVWGGYYGPAWGWGLGPGWGGWGWGWGPGIYDGFYGGYYGPAVTYYQLVTPYDWQWKQGPVRLRLSYSRDGKSFEHSFEIVRERAK